MIDIYTLLNMKVENMGEEEKIYFEEFTEKLKEKLVEELIHFKTESLLDLAKKDREKFKSDLDGMLYNGFKGYDKMSMETLITMYLENRSDIDFMNLVQNIN